MLSIWSSFADLPDPRTGNAQRHNLLDVLTIALTGLSHLAENGSGERVGPSGSLALAAYGYVGSRGSEDVEGEFSQCGEVFRSVVTSVSGAVLVEPDVEHPVQAVFDPPMGAHGGSDAHGVHPCR